jgi:hypothetical protein
MRILKPIISLFFAAALCLSGPSLHFAKAQNGPLYCNQVASAFPSAAVTTNLVSPAATGSARILICGYMILTTAGTGQLVYGTGATCTTPTQISPLFVAGQVGSDNSMFWRGLLVPNGSNLCVTTGAGTTAAQVFVFWTYG